MNVEYLLDGGAATVRRRLGPADGTETVGLCADARLTRRGVATSLLPTKLGTEPAMLGPEPAKLGTEPTMLGTEPAMQLRRRCD